MNTNNIQDVQLSRYSNKELFELYNINKDQEIRNELINRYMYLCDILAKKYINRGIEYEDLYQVASLALVFAVERFKMEKGFEFSSFATPTIIGEIKKHFRDKGWSIRVPRRIQELSKKVYKAKENLTSELNRAPLIKEIADYLESNEEEILEAMEASNVYDLKSLDVSIDEDATSDILLQDVIGKSDLNFDNIEYNELIENALNNMSINEQEIFKLRFIKNKTQNEIAKIMQVSQMTISRIEKKILTKINNELAMTEK